MIRRGYIVNFLILFLAYYVLHHTVNGNRSVFALMELNKDVQIKQAKLETLKANRLNLEHKVTLMKNESLDLDLLDEQARKILGLASSSETVVFTDVN